MTLTPSTVRLDLKCGKGSISKGEKCTKGPAISVAGVALGLGLAAGAIALRRRGRRLNATPERKAPNVPKDPPKPPASATGPERRAARQKQAQDLVDRVIKNNKKVSEEFGKIDFPANASRPITQRTDPARVTSAAESLVSWTSTPGNSLSMSVAEAEKLIRKKGRIIDIYAMPDLDMAQAQADKVIGRNTLATKKVGEAYRRFYVQDRNDALRLDLKCGKGAISKGEKCHKGPATSVSPKTVAVAGTGTAVVVGLALSRKKWGPATQRAFKEAVAVAPLPGTAPIPPKGSKFLAKGYAGAIYVAKDKMSVFKINFKRTIGGRTAFAKELSIQAEVRKRGVSTPDVIAFDRKRSIAQIEYLDGYKTMHSLMEEGVSQAQRTKYANTFMREMQKLHTAGYSHSDMHLGNTMIKNGDVKIIDWGYAKPIKQMPGWGLRNDLKHISDMLKKLDPDTHKRFKPAAEAFVKSNPKADSEKYAEFWSSFFTDQQRGDALCITPSTVRLDLKCGKGAISKGEKCTKGLSTRSSAAKEKSAKAQRVVKALTIGAGITGAALLGVRALSALKAERANRRFYQAQRRAQEARIANMERTQREVATANRANVSSDFMRSYSSQGGASSTRPTTHQSVYSPPKGSVEAKVQAAFRSTVPYSSTASNDPNPDVSAAWVKIKEPKRRKPYKGDPDLSSIWARGFEP